MASRPAIDLDAWQHHRWERPPRYYELWLHQDLFGAWIVTRVWGGIGQETGDFRHEPQADYAEALVRLEQLAKTRRARKYELHFETAKSP